MAWLYVPGLECSTKDYEPDLSSLASPTAPRVTSKGKLLQPRSLLSSWRRNAWMKRLSGMTLPPSTLDHGAANWIASLQASLASLTVSPESAKASKTSAGYGLTSLESFASLNRHLSGSKTCRDLFQPEALSKSYLTLPASGSMLNGVCSPRPKLAPAISAREFSFWPTADCNTSTYSNGRFGMNLREASSSWQTPQTSDTNGAREPDGKRSLGLNTLATNWPTPCANDDNKSPEAYRNMRENKLGRKGAAAETISSLQVKVQAWPTPAARVSRGENHEDHLSNGTGRLHLDQLPNFVKFVFSPQAQRIHPGKLSLNDSSTSPRRLNPAFASWLMGWPWWWTNSGQISFAQSEMVLYRYRLQQHLFCLLNEPGSSEVAA